MALTIDDLKPQDQKISIRGVEVTCKPLRLSHALVLTQVGELFKDVKAASSEDIAKAQANLDAVVNELIPELKDVQLGMQDTIDLITQLMNMIEPSDSVELKKSGVKFDASLKAETTT